MVFEPVCSTTGWLKYRFTVAAADGAQTLVDLKSRVGKKDLPWGLFRMQTS